MPVIAAIIVYLPLYSHEYTYYNSGTETTSRVMSESVTGAGINFTRSYGYDEKNNLTSVSDGNGNTITYTYDAMNQFTSAQDGENSYTYSYDKGGNILSKTVNGVTALYSYEDDGWGDLLTAYDGDSITYDTVSNPLTYRGGMVFTWTGRELTGAAVNGQNISYAYNADGMRTKKTIGSTVTYNTVDGSKIISQKTGTASMYFDYSADGNPFHMSYNGSFYYFVLNGQGDVIALLDSSGNTVVEYTYDPWGKVLSVTGTLAGTLGQANPIRYRGYYYDSETGFYYLQSRYYDPETGRFISSDGYLSTGQDILGNNMFAYCLNNPVNNHDPSGKFALTATFCGIALWKIGVAFVGIVGTFILADTIAKNPPAFPSISLPKIEVKPKSEVKDKTNDIASSKPHRDPVHHIVAKSDPRAEESRKILRDVGIEPLTDPRNLVILPQSYHVSLHTTAYHNYVTERLRPVEGDKAGVEATLATLKKEILARSAAGIRWD